MRNTVLVIDDDIRIVDLMRRELQRGGFNCLSALTGRDALELVSQDDIDLITLDLILPDIDGLEILRSIRRMRHTPVIVLSARSNSAEKVRCLDSGADDYLTKPFDPAELMARVRAQFRKAERWKGMASPVVVVHGRTVVDFAAQEMILRGKRISLTRTEWALLREMASSNGKLVHHDDLLAAVWGPSYRGETDYLRMWIGRLRHKLRSAGGDDVQITTYYGRGYQLTFKETEALVADSSN